jgi:hypothetical protein
VITLSSVAVAFCLDHRQERIGRAVDDADLDGPLDDQDSWTVGEHRRQFAEQSLVGGGQRHIGRADGQVGGVIDRDAGLDGGHRGRIDRIGRGGDSKFLDVNVGG